MDWLEAEAFVKRYRCSICSKALVVLHSEAERYRVRCADHAHQGFVRNKSLTQMWREGDALPIHIQNIIEKKMEGKMERELGKEAVTQLAPYRGVPKLTQDQAALILRTIWPKATEVEVVKGAMICAQYGLNPLMRHLYLIEFKEWEELPDGSRRATGRSTWAPVLGIGATRLIAMRQGAYTYLDGPRIMSNSEQEQLFGSVDDLNIWAITIIGDQHGRKAPGYGNWPAGQRPYGYEKGNTRFGMAMIRSERNAFNRLYPAEMPANIEVADLSKLDMIEEPQIAAPMPAPGGEIAATDLCTEAQRRKIFASARERGWKDEELHNAVFAKFGLDSTKALTKSQASSLIALIELGEWK